MTSSADQAPKVVGTAYAINTIGSILGSYCAGMVLIPHLGSSYALRVAVLFLLATLAAVAFIGLERKLTKWAYVGSAACLLVVSLLVGNLDYRNIIKSAYTQALDRSLSFPELVKYYSRDYEEFKLITEGETGIISLSHDKQDGERFRQVLRLKTNGLNESLYQLDNLQALPKYEALLGFLPYLFAKNPQNAFLVGYGGGYTVDLLTSTDLKAVYVAELERGILEAALELNQQEIAHALCGQIKRESDRFQLACGEYQDKLLGKYFVANRKFEKALPHLEAYYGRYPQDPDVLDKLVTCYMKKGDQEKAGEFSAYLSQVLKERIETRRQLAASYQSRGLLEDARLLDPTIMPIGE